MLLEAVVLALASHSDMIANYGAIRACCYLFSFFPSTGHTISVLSVLLWPAKPSHSLVVL